MPRDRLQPSNYAVKLAELTVHGDDTEFNSSPVHGKLRQVGPAFENVFFVCGEMPSTPSRPFFERMFFRYSRTMTVVRRPDGGLVIINSMKLNEGGLQELDELGEVRHIVRLGTFHGVDDAFWLRRYPGAQYWHVQGMTPAKGLPDVVPRTLVDGSPAGPIPGARIVEFEGANFPEAILVLPQGVAITCDSIQNHKSIFGGKYNSWLVSFGIWKIGLLGEARLGPIWLDNQGDRSALRSHFHKLLQLDWDVLVPGHGWPLKSDAKRAVGLSVKSQLPPAPRAKI